MNEDSLRASDADREATVARLQSAFAEGRLELAEIDERTTAAYAAKTLGDLAALTRDLPSPSAAPAPAPRPASTAPQPPQHSGGNEMWRYLQYGLPPVVVINFVIWLAIGLSGNWVHPWWVWILVAWACGAFGGPDRRHRISGGGRREIERRHERDRRRDERDRRRTADPDDPEPEV